MNRLSPAEKLCVMYMDLWASRMSDMDIAGKKGETDRTTEAVVEGRFKGDLHTDYGLDTLLYKGVDGGRVLDFGCGEGARSFAMLKEFSPREYQGIDVNQHHIDIALESKKKIPGSEVLHFNLYDGRVLPWKDGYFDVAVSFGVFEHLSNPEENIREIMRVLKSGGRFIMLCTSFNGLVGHHHMYAVTRAPGVHLLFSRETVRRAYEYLLKKIYPDIYPEDFTLELQDWMRIYDLNDLTASKLAKIYRKLGMKNYRIWFTPMFHAKKSAAGRILYAISSTIVKVPVLGEYFCKRLASVVVKD